MRVSSNEYKSKDSIYQFCKRNGIKIVQGDIPDYIVNLMNTTRYLDRVISLKERIK